MGSIFRKQNIMTKIYQNTKIKWSEFEFVLPLLGSQWQNKCSSKEYELDFHIIYFFTHLLNNLPEK